MKSKMREEEWRDRNGKRNDPVIEFSVWQSIKLGFGLGIGLFIWGLILMIISFLFLGAILAGS